MAARSNKIIAERALKIFWDDRKNWTYLLGSTGRIAGQDDKVKAYFNYFQGQGRISKDFNFDQWLAVHKGKHTGDCSNTVLNYLVYGNETMGCNSCWSSSAPQNWEQVSKDKVEVGMAAWKQGHVGLVVHTNPDIITIDIPGPSSLQDSTFRLLNISKEYPTYWTGFAKFPKSFVTYDYSEGRSSAPVITSVTGALRKADKEYKVGQVLTANDFNITVKYSDGTTKINPTNWAALNTTTSTSTKASLELKAGVNEIFVTYGGVSSTFKVNVGATYHTVRFTDADIDALKKICPNIKVE